MISILKAGWRARRSLRIYESWVEFFEGCPIPDGIVCAECEKYSREVGTVDQCRSWVAWYRRVLS